ncbi:MAG TPA: GAF domain-containing sensor histidine kinase [Candidatus Limnocylindria bacterium]|nr:GAF domain-containing sensor histidine kinase [Candidatus Limnocylindria bacterium]
MNRGTRLFVLLLLVALPPLILLGLLEVFATALVLRLGQGTTLLVVALAGTLWAAVVALVASRSMAAEVRSLVDLAERGSGAAEEASAVADDAHRRLGAALDERNRQLAELAERVRTAPISNEPTSVAQAMVAAARSVTGNPTWTLAVLASDDAALRPAVYGGDGDPANEVGELHRWAAAAGDDPSRPRLAEGPWGRFVVVPVGAEGTGGVRALLLSPWEGRPAPSSAEVNLLQLLGEHAATAIEHALLYRQLRERTDQLNRMAAIQTDFLRGVTHDLQTPLTSIRALASELAEAPQTDAAAQVDLQTIAYQADRLRRMVGQLLVASRLEAGAVTPRQEVFRLEPLVERTWQALRAGDRPFEIRHEGPEFLVVADPDRLEQVLWALLDNAVKYSPAGSPISVEITGRPGDEGLRAEIAVGDAGAGMDPETAEHAFDQFYRSSAARRDAPDGSGVGLYAARGLVRAMGGDVTLETRLGAGTRVVCSLPAEPVEEPASVSPAPAHDRHR